MGRQNRVITIDGREMCPGMTFTFTRLGLLSHSPECGVPVLSALGMTLLHTTPAFPKLARVPVPHVGHLLSLLTLCFFLHSLPPGLSSLFQDPHLEAHHPHPTHSPVLDLLLHSRPSSPSYPCCSRKKPQPIDMDSALRLHQLTQWEHHLIFCIGHIRDHNLMGRGEGVTKRLVLKHRPHFYDMFT